MFTNARLALCVDAVLGSTSAAHTAPQHPTIRQAESTAQHQVSRSASGDDSLAPAPGQSTRANAVYFDPSPAPFNAFTYCASVLLTPSTSKRVVQGHSLKIQEVPEISGSTETQVAVEAETIFDVSPGGLYYANLVVTGVPVVPPTKPIPPNS